MTARLLALARAIERLSARDMHAFTAMIELPPFTGGNPQQIDAADRYYLTRSLLRFSRSTISETWKGQTK